MALPPAQPAFGSSPSLRDIRPVGRENDGFPQMLAKWRPRSATIPATDDGVLRESMIKYWSQLLSVELMEYNAFQVSSRAQ
mmetsp:Transcript_14541/g.34694  ORF Transcript_14541/g.34694 Transcript_14541/m.34694 type:complete len:81 (-) Transcript_14541:322-564(-)